MEQIESSLYTHLPSTIQTIDLISTLPKELSFIIFSYLPIPSLGSASLVSKNWKILAQDEQVWTPILKKIHLKTSSKYQCIKTTMEESSLHNVKKHSSSSLKFIQSQIKMASKPTLANRFNYFLERLIEFFSDFEIVLPRKVKIQLVYLMLKYIKDEFEGKKIGKSTPIPLNLFIDVINILKMDHEKKDYTLLQKKEKIYRKRSIPTKLTWSKLVIRLEYLTLAVQRSKDFDKSIVHNLLKDLFFHYFNLGFELDEILKDTKKENSPINILHAINKNHETIGMNPSTLYKLLFELQSFQTDLISELPKELSFIIFSYLPVSSLGSASLVSKNWKILSQDDSVWNPVFEKFLTPYSKRNKKFSHIQFLQEERTLASILKVKDYCLKCHKFMQEEIKMAQTYSFLLFRLLDYLKTYVIVLPKKLKIDLAYAILKQIEFELTEIFQISHIPIKFDQFKQVVEILKLDEEEKEYTCQEMTSSIPLNRSSKKSLTWDTLFFRVDYLTQSVQQSEDFNQSLVKEMLKSLFIHFIRLGFDLNKKILWNSNWKYTPIEYLQHPYEKFKEQDSPLYQALDSLYRDVETFPSDVLFK